MQIQTTRFGKVSVNQEDIVIFPEGLIGFCGKTRFVILDHKQGSPFKWLQSVEEPELAFIVIQPPVFRPDYAPVLLKTDLESLGLRQVQDEALVYAIVVVPEDPAKMYANLLGPLVINKKARIGKQVILSSDTYSTCHYIVDEMKASYGVSHARPVAKA